MNNRILKNDRYRKNREGYSRILNISCSNCKAHILKYQKDGPGSLKRMYFDRIHSPSKLSNLQNKDLKEINILKCPNCKKLIAYPYIYKKENRKSFRVFKGSIIKKIQKTK